MKDYETAYREARKLYKHIKKSLTSLGFLHVKNPVYRHHAVKNFKDYDVKVFSCWRIRLHDQGFVHVMLICYLDSFENPVVKLHYQLAMDPILYGLRNWYSHGGTAYADRDLSNVREAALMCSPMESNEYTRKRFRNGTVKAHVRAFFTMIKDKLSSFL